MSGAPTHLSNFSMGDARMDLNDPRWLQHLDVITAWGEASTGNETDPPTDQQLWAISRIRADLNLPEQIDPTLLTELRAAFNAGRRGLEWNAVDSGELRAVSSLVDGGYYVLRPQGGGWVVDLVIPDDMPDSERSEEADDELVEVARLSAGGVKVEQVRAGDLPGRKPRVGWFPTEAKAKAGAAEYEAGTHPEDDGCAIYTESYHGVLRNGVEVSVHSLRTGDVFTEVGYDDPVLVHAVASGIDGDLHLDLGSPDGDDSP
ncbi:hypothetical protein [Plantactinospora sp. CA-290183]|uniref:hypothetical protein n=1 Tax=Plantactinospora sp. CA-290183 TaxID=3240006 RepID=UPI003D90C1BA